MKIIIQKEVNNKIHTIKSPNDWLKYAPPRGKENQWKDGFSAKEFAKYVCSESSAFKEHIEQILSTANREELIGDYYGIPEATSELGDGKSGGRKPDLLLIGDKCIVSIEAKVNETFGPTVHSAKASLVSKDERPNYLAHYLFGDNIPANIDSLRYQLLTATVGAIEHAKNERKDKAYMLVLELKESIPNKETSNDKAIREFCTALGIKPGDSIIRHGVTCWINKFTVQISHEYNLITAQSPL
jgi:hypothetical protein